MKVKLYIAMSLDGYIADDQGLVDWISGDGSQANHAGTYEEFIKEIDSVIMGYNTYHQVRYDLSPDVWAYEGKETYVLTSKKIDDRDAIFFVNESLETLIDTIKDKRYKHDIWICGGASIVKQAIQKDLIDEYRIAIIPTVLSSGIPLFQSEQKHDLKLIATQNYNGIVEITYERR